MDDTSQATNPTASTGVSPGIPGSPSTQLIQVNLPGLGDTYLDRSMASRVETFISEASAHGVNLHFNSAYRTPEHQAALHNDPHAITPADNSLHSAGFAVDVNYSSLPTAQQEVIRNAATAAGLSWGGGFRAADPPHFYMDPPIDRAAAIANATSQYSEEIARQNHPAQTHEPENLPSEGTSPANNPTLEKPPASNAAPVGNPQTTSQWLNDPAHPDHSLFAQARAQVHAMDEQFNRVPDWRSDNLAASLVVQAKASELRGIATLVLNDDGSRLFVADNASPKDVFRRIASVDVMPAMQQSIAESTHKIDTINQMQAQMAPEQSTLQQLGGPTITHGPQLA